MASIETYQNPPFGHCMFDLISTDYLSLLQYLKSIELPSVLLFDKHHFTIRTFTNYRYHLKIFLADMGASALLLLCHNLLILLFKFFILLLLLRQCDLSWDELLLVHWHLLLLLLVVVNTLHHICTGIGCRRNCFCLLHAFCFLSIFRLSLIYFHLSFGNLI